MTHLEAQNRIKGCHDHLTLSVSRYAQGRLGQDDAGESGEAQFWGASILGELGLTQPLCFSSLAPHSYGAALSQGFDRHCLEMQVA